MPVHVPADDPTSAAKAPTWPPLAAVRAVDELFGDLAPDTLDAIRMAAGELAENVIKFGEQVDGVTGHVSISRTDDGVEIRTNNRLSDVDRARELSDRLRRIGEGGSLEGQFVSRITEIMSEPEQPTTALGLLRIAYEGLFRISCNYANATMTVVAARSIR
jgi:hypothetical protein